MRILFYFGHPAQFHFAKHTISNLKTHGHEVLLLLKSKDILEDLVREQGWDYINIQPKVRKNSKISIATASMQRTVRVLREARSFGADIMIGTDASIAQAALILRKPSLTVLEDDVEIIPRLAKVTYPFSTAIVVPEECNVGKWSAKKLGYPGYMKLAYLHPRYFQRQEIDALRVLPSSKPYCLVRLAKLTAHHDDHVAGIDASQLEKIFAMARAYGLEVYVNSENDMSDSLKTYQLNMASAVIHQILANATLLVSDSQSMTMEAAMLGVPSLRLSNFAGRIRVLEALEKNYELTFGFRNDDFEAMMVKMEDLLNMDDLIDEFQRRRHLMLNNKIDVTAFFTWLIEGYPKSLQELRQSDNWQEMFRDK